MLLAYSWKAVIYSQYSLTSPHTGRKEELREEVEAFVDIIAIPSLPATAQRLQVYSKEDPDCSKVREYCKTAWPGKNSIESSLKPYWEVRGLLISPQ